MRATGNILLLASVLSLLAGPTTAGTIEPVADLVIDTGYSSNLFMNRDAVQDFMISPEVTVGLDFSHFWTAGYTGSLRIYADNTDLIHHSHSIFLFANPAWGTDGQNEFLARVSLGTQRFMDAYSSVNNLRPVFETGIILEPVSWFRWSLTEVLSYNWFYSDPSMDYLDLWSRMSAQFTFQSRTTVTPRFSYGLRRYTAIDASGVSDRMDHQIQAGIHFSQGLWKNAGLQADYAYNHSFGTSGLIARNQDAQNFTYLEETFIFSGHSAALGLKQLIGRSWTLGTGLNFGSRLYSGWSAIDSSGTAIGKDRFDLRLGPYLGVDYTWTPDEKAGPSIPRVTVNAGYSYLRQWSNHWFYDTDLHSLSLGIELNW